MLGIKNPSQIYKEAHTGTYAMMRLKGDNTVNHALNSRLERESSWTRKSSSVVEADKIFKDIVAAQNITLPVLETPREREALINKTKKKQIKQ